MNLNDHGPGSQRDAIASASEGDTVDFQTGLTGTIHLTSGPLMIDSKITITGLGASVITVSGDNAQQVLNITASSSVTISDLTIAEGDAVGGGGGILNYGYLILTGCILLNNSASSGGGGIFNGGTLKVTNSTLSGNSAGYGGGIDNFSGTVTVTNSTFSENTCVAFGGGINNVGTLTVMNSTFSDNKASAPNGSGGGIYNSFGDNAIIDNSTFSQNIVVTGAGIYNGGTAPINTVCQIAQLIHSSAC
jgi:hypothetical protein